MNAEDTGPASIDEYIAGFPPRTQGILRDLHAAVRAAAPDAAEKMSYRMPTFALEGNLVHFAAYAKHIGFYPAPSGIEAFKKELSIYKGAKGSVQFPIDEPIPLDLVRRIVEFRVAENLAEAAAKNRKR